MYLTVYIALYGWPLVVAALFAAMRPRRAVIVAFVGAWLFLPEASIKMAGLPDWTKAISATYGAMLGVAVFDSRSLAALRPRWIDIPMAVWCLAPLASSLTNGLGAYDGASAALDQTVRWGIPYALGRMYFSDREGLRDLVVGVLIGGLIYVPLCLYEIRMSPHLHKTVYGFHAQWFGQTKRFGGFRPSVFMQHGIMVGMWMASAAIVSAWMWASGALRRLWGAPIWSLFAALAGTTVLVKSLAAILWLAVGLGVIASLKLGRTRLAALALVAIPPAYLTARVGMNWSGDSMVQAAETISGARAQSLRYRFANEEMLKDKAAQRPLFGWGGWNRSNVRNDRGKLIGTTDSLWIIAYGKTGGVGLLAMLFSILLPVALLLARTRAQWWLAPAHAPFAAMATLLLVYMLDNLINAMLNPVYVLGMGGLSGALAASRLRRSTSRRVGAGSSLARRNRAWPAGQTASVAQPGEGGGRA